MLQNVYKLFIFSGCCLITNTNAFPVGDVTLVDQQVGALMCHALKASRADDIQSCLTACYDFSQDRANTSKMHYYEECSSIVLPVYLLNGAANIECRYHEDTFRTMRSFWHHHQKSLECPRSPGLTSLYELLDTVYEKHIQPGKAEAQHAVWLVDGKDSTPNFAAVIKKGFYYSYHYVPFDPQQTMYQYWETFAGHILERVDTATLGGLQCYFQHDQELLSIRPPMPCEAFFAAVQQGGTVNGRDINEYDFDYLRVDAGSITSHIDGQMWIEKRFPIAANRRVSLNIVEESRHQVFGCLVNQLFSPGGAALAAGIKTTGLHATNTRGASQCHRQLDNIVIYTNTKWENDVQKVLHFCVPAVSASHEYIPMMNKIAPGVFTADDNGKSFGTYRADCVAEAAWLMMSQGLISSDWHQDGAAKHIVTGIDSHLRELFHMYAVQLLVDRGRVDRCMPFVLND